MPRCCSETCCRNRQRNCSPAQSVDLAHQLPECDSAETLPDRVVRALRDRYHDSFHVATDPAGLRRLALIDGDHGSWLHGLVNIEERDTSRVFDQLGASVSPSAGLYQSRATEGLKQPADDHRIGVYAYRQRVRIKNVIRKGERSHDVYGESKFLVDHSA